MLYKIICDKFVIDNNPTGTITFHDGLNVVKGHNSGTNSIGKSTMLLIIDFAFGGKTYTQDSTVVSKIDHHLIKFQFTFNSISYFFSRNTSTPNVVNECDENYNIVKTISLQEYTQKLFDLYNIPLSDISFRQIIGRVSRIYGKGNSNERAPLSSHEKEGSSESIDTILKLFNKYYAIKNIIHAIKKKEEYKKGLSKADSIKLIKLINKKEFDKNSSRINELENELQNLTKYGKQDLLYLEPQDLELVSELKTKHSNLINRKKQLWRKYYAIKNNTSKNTPITTTDFSELLEYFPNANIKVLSDIENFHSKISNILLNEFNNSMNEILIEINDITKQILSVEDEMQKIDLPKRISENTINSISNIKKEIDLLKQQNELFIKRKETLSELKILKPQKEELYKNAFISITTDINHEMEALNAYIYGNNVNPPKLNIMSSSKYTLSTESNNGTAERFKNLILLDMALIKLTPTKILIHDTPLFKNIGQEPMSKIIELYDKLAGQIFIVIDETNKYNNLAQNIVNNNTVIELSAGHELFGSSWPKKE